MKKNSLFKKFLVVALVFTMLFAFASCGSNKADETFVVGICQLVQHEALDAATQGFMDALKAELGDKVEFDLQNASGDSNVCNTIVNSFVSKKVDLIMANATPALLSAYNATETIPILGTSVTTYGSALNIQNFSGTVGGNVSGTSDLAPLDGQANMILELFPQAKTVGLLYCSAEPNSLYQVEEMERFLNGKVQTKRFTFADSNDVASVTEKACADCDVIYIPTDNTAATCSATIGNIVKNHKIPVIAGEAGLCKNCGVAALSISYYDLGVTTGKMAAKVLKGESDISKMPIEYAPAEKQFNKAFCDELGVVVPSDYKEMK